MKNSFLASLLLFLVLACTSEKVAVDLLITNAEIYTVDENFSKAEAMAIKDGKIEQIGNMDDILGQYTSKNVIDVEGKPIYPGLYDSHSHFVGLGYTLDQCNLVGTISLDEIISKLKVYQKANPDKDWIVGRGWDQNDWEVKEFPTKATLDEAFPDTPVFLTRIDGHAAYCNSEALRRAKVGSGSKIDGGEVIRKNGEATGILIDNAMGFVGRILPRPSKEEKRQMLLNAQEACLSKGLTTVSDAGLQQEDIEMIDEMHQDGSLKIRDYAMVSIGLRNLEYYTNKGVIKTDRLHVRSFKLYADGALGSRGACLLEPYADRPETSGFLLLSEKELRLNLKEIAASGYQANTHCIGDSANRLILDIYGELLGEDNDRRWRIEHSQIVHKDDIDKFGKYNIIPSVQGTHATSDMYWAGDRLGDDRVKTAYAFKDLLSQNGVLTHGSDFPVEAVNPLYGFHSLFARQDANNYPKDGFQMENAISKEDALRACTIWSAYGNFEEEERGSLEAGKLADFIVLDKDIMEIPASEVREAAVLKTFISGEKVWEKK